MTDAITGHGIECDRCCQACPTQDIRVHCGLVDINPNLCNDSVSEDKTLHYIAAYSTNKGCFPSLQPIATHTDYWESWFATYNVVVAQLRANTRPPYWEQWFTLYSQRLQSLLSLSPART